MTDEDKGFRYYKTPHGDFPSVTTVLSELSKDYIEEWRERVGHEEAKAVSDYAKARGTRIHALCETYVNNELTDEVWRTVNMVDQATFRQIKKVLDENVDNVRAQELRLYSKYLESAGTVDLVAEYEGSLSIIDFKTSKRYKDRESIKGYFMQASAYAVMWEELFKEPITRVVIVIGVDNVPEAQVFKAKRNDHIFDYVSLRKTYKEKYNV